MWNVNWVFGAGAIHLGDNTRLIKAGDYLADQEGIVH